MKVLMPVDITHPQEDLVEQIDCLLPLKNAEITLLFVKEILPSYERVMDSMADFPEDFQHQIEKNAKGVLSKIESKLSSKAASVCIEIVSGPTSWMINEVAKDKKIDLTIVTPGHDANLRRFLLSSTSAHVVRHTESDVLVLRQSPSCDSLKNIVIALDGSHSSARALSRAVSLLDLKNKNKNCEVTVTNVVSIAPALKIVSPVTFLAALEDNLIMEGEAMLAAAVANLDKSGVKNAHTQLKVGDPANEIIICAEKKSAQLIVTGARGISAVQQIILGSVSDRVSAHAPCSTLVVKDLASGAE